MAFSPAFTIGQSASSPNLVVATDTSSGSDVLIVSRKITFTDSSGNTVVPSGTVTSFVSWPLATNPLSIDLLTSDMDLNVLVEWLNVSGIAIYSSEADYALNEYNKQFFVYLFQQQALKPNIVQDANYFSNLAQYWTDIIGSIKVVEYAADLSNGQNNINQATYMMQNQNLFF